MKTGEELNYETMMHAEVKAIYLYTSWTMRFEVRDTLKWKLDHLRPGHCMRSNRLPLVRQHIPPENEVEGQVRGPGSGLGYG